MDSRVAVIGDGESIKGFSAIGMDVFPCSDANNAPRLLRKLSDSGEYGIIYVTEELYEALGKDNKRVAGQISPAVIPIPGVKGNTGIGVSRLRSFVEKAVGSDIIFND